MSDLSESSGATGDASPVAPLFWFDIAEASSPPQRWRLEAYSGHLALTPPGETQPMVFPRSELGKKVELIQRPPLLVITQPRKIVFQFGSPANLARFREWQGPPSYDYLLVLLKRRYSWVFPVALLFMVFSLPIPGNEKEGLKAEPFKVWTFILGVILACMGVLRKWKPHRVLFLIDSFWFALLAGEQIWRILKGDSLWWFVLVVFEVWLIVGGIELYQSFARTKRPEAKTS